MSESKKKSTQVAKPRLRNVREVILVEAVNTKATGVCSVFQQSAKCSIVADLDAQIITVKIKGDKTFIFHFSRLKHWHPAMGTAKELEA